MDPGPIYIGVCIVYNTCRKWTPIDYGPGSIFYGRSIFYGIYKIWTPIEYGPRSNLYGGPYSVSHIENGPL